MKRRPVMEAYRVPVTFAISYEMDQWLEENCGDWSRSDFLRLLIKAEMQRRANEDAQIDGTFKQVEEQEQKRNIPLRDLRPIGKKMCPSDIESYNAWIKASNDEYDRQMAENGESELFYRNE